MKRNADNHLNDGNALVLDEYPGEPPINSCARFEEQIQLFADEPIDAPEDTLLAENNWSDLEDQQGSSKSISDDELVADDDLATDDLNADTDSDEPMD